MVVEGTLEATGKSYIPTVAYVWVNLTQVQMNDKEVTTAVSNNPSAKAADADGSDANVQGNGSLHVLPQTVNLDRGYTLLHVNN